MVVIVRTSALPVLALAILLPFHALAAPDAAPPTLGDAMRAALARDIAAHGLDPGMFFAAPVTLEVPRADGSREVVTLPFGEALDRIGGGNLWAPTEEGFVGPEVMVGDTLHLWAAAGLGSQLLQTSESELAPATPPVLLLAPAFIDVGGPVRNIWGSYDLGVHTTGSFVFGSNVDTAPGPALVWVPLVTGGFVLDEEIDFVGHALLTQGQVCFFGVCAAVGFMFADGVALFDAGTSTFPVVP